MCDSDCDSDGSDEPYENNGVKSLIKRQNEFIKSMVNPYVLHKWGINEEERIKHRNDTETELQKYLLDLLLDNKHGTLLKYIQSLRFIIYIIETNLSNKEQRDYCLHVKCQLGKEELQFLQCFNEFDIITKTNI